MALSSSLFQKASKEDDFQFEVTVIPASRKREDLQVWGTFKEGQEEETVPASLVEKDREYAELLNNKSKSYQAFKLTPADQEKLARYSDEEEKLEKQVEALIKARRATSKLKSALRFVDDPELAEQIKKHIDNSKRNFKHEVNCKIDKINAAVIVTIIDCDNEKNVKEMFNSFLKAEPTMLRKGNHLDREDVFRLEVIFKLRDRDELMEGLRLSQQVFLIPESQRFQKC